MSFLIFIDTFILFKEQALSLIVLLKEANNQKYKVVLVNNIEELESNYMGVLERGFYDAMIVLNSPSNNLLLEKSRTIGCSCHCVWEK